MSRPSKTLLAAGGILVVGLGSVSLLSRSFVYDEGHAGRPIPLFVVAMLALSVVWAFAVWKVGSLAQPLPRPTIAALWTVAIVSRLVFLGSNPIQEDDFYRYLWDGHVLKCGANPYAHPPSGMRGAVEEGSAGRQVFDRINHPDLPTIYPPVSIAVFAASQTLFPWSLDGLRVVLLLFDLGTMVLLWRLLGRLNLPKATWIVYAWCPLLAKEFANSAHHDAIAVFFTTAFLASVVARLPAAAGLALSAGILSKVYPVVLVPLFLVWLARAGWRQAAWGVSSLLLPIAAATLLFGSGLDPAGFGAYATRWRANSSLFRLLEWPLGPLAARIASGSLVILISAAQALRLRYAHHPADLLRPFFVTLAALFCLSPVEDPWYFSWVLPLACFFPSVPWVVWAALLNSYYLGFWIEYRYPDAALSAFRNQAHGLLLLVQHVPFYVSLVWWGVRAESSATAAQYGRRTATLRS